MRIFIRLLILFALAVGLAIGARYNPGNVVIFFPPTRIDLSLNLTLFLLAVLFFLLYVFIRAIVATRDMPKAVAEYRQNKREREANRHLRDSLKALFEGRFGHAEKSALKARDWQDNFAAASLIAARAAHFMGQYERRDNWLSQLDGYPNYRAATLVTSAELLVEQHQHTRALESIDELNRSGVRHLQVLRWALKANQQAKKWDEVLRLVKILDKHKAVHPALSSRLREMAYADVLKRQSHDGTSLKAAWQQVPSSDKKLISVALLAAQAFNSHGLFDQSRQICEEILEQHWDERFLHCYRDAAAPEGSAALLSQIERCERWFKDHPTFAELSLTMGVLCYRQKLWGKAQKHFEDALNQATEPRVIREANLKLAHVFEVLGQAENAARCYKECALATRL